MVTAPAHPAHVVLPSVKVSISNGIRLNRFYLHETDESPGLFFL